MSIPFSDIKANAESIRHQALEAITAVIDSGQFVLGPAVQSFEEQFAQFLGVPYAVGVNSGSSALQLALLACGVGPGDEVITTALTFAATVAAIYYVGAKPVLVDCELDSRNIDVSEVEKAITAKTKAIIPVHLHGLVADMDPLMELANRHRLWVIEDACQAHGARYKGRRAGSIGHFGCFSFYPAKNLGSFGEGGMVVCSEAAACEHMRSLRNYGQSGKYNHQYLGYNYRLETIQAAVLRVKLPYLDQWNALRRQWAQLYRQQLALGSAVIALPSEPAWAEHVYHVYAVRCRNREPLAKHLAGLHISVGMHYPAPIHKLPAFAELDGSFPIAEQLAEQMLSLPMFAELTAEQVGQVCQAINSFAVQR